MCRRADENVPEIDRAIERILILVLELQEIIADSLVLNSFPLYHYTNISSLEAILNNNSIKFNELNNVDDMQEKESENFINHGNYTYVSCWTGARKESIPMWYLYCRGKPEDMLRIQLPAHPFKEDNFSNMSMNIVENGKFRELTKQDDLQKYNGKIHVRTPNNVKQLLHKVYYSDNPELLCPIESEQLYNPNRVVIANYHSNGLIKNTYWSFQQEYRYIVSFSKEDKITPPDAIFLNLKDSAINRMKIITGAEFDKYKDLENLLSKYNLAYSKSVLTKKVKITQFNE